MSLFSRLQDAALEWTWRMVSRRPLALIVAGTVLALVSAAASSQWLRLNADQDALVSQDLPYQKTYLEHIRNFGDQEYLFLVIRTGGTEEGRSRAAFFSDRVAARLAARPDLIQAVYFRMRPQDMGQGALLFSSLEEARTLGATAAAMAPLVNRWTAEPTLAGLFSAAGLALSGGAAAGEDGGPGLASTDPALLLTALDGLDALLTRMRARISGGAPHGTEQPFNLADLGARHFFTANGRLLVMRIMPAKDYGTMDVIGKPLEFIREAMAQAREEVPGVDAGLTGRPALAADEMTTTDQDMLRAGVVSAVLMAALFICILRGWVLPLLILTTLGMAEAWTFGFALVTLGELNLLSIVFALVLVGLGVGYGVHVALRFSQGRCRGLSVDQAVKDTVFSQGAGVFLSASTTLSAFLTVLGSDFVGLAQLGLVAGAGIVFCFLAQYFVLPALLLVLGRRNLLGRAGAGLTALPFLEGLTDRAWTLVLVLGLAGLALIPWTLKVDFSYNVLELQAEGLESVAFEKALLEESDESTWYAMMAARDLDEVRALKERFAALPRVGKIESILDFLPPDQEAKAALFAPADRAIRDAPPAEAVPADVDGPALAEALDTLAEALEGLEEKLFAAGARDELARLGRTLDGLRGLAGTLAADPSLAPRLSGLQTALGQEALALLAWFKDGLKAREVVPASLPPALRDIYMGKDGRFQLKISPTGDVWDFDNLQAFVDVLRTVDPEVSGVPVSMLESAKLMRRTFLSAAVWTLILVTALFLGYSRSLSYTLLALIPLGAGILWLLEIMGLSGIHFNLANFFAIPMLIGVGVDGGVHLLARRQELGSARGIFLTSSPMAVAVTVATTVIGFCGLLFAHHKGLAALGAVMVLGSLTCMAGCLLVLPAAMKILHQRTEKRGTQ